MSATGHPSRQFIVKVHGRCNLACTYCYLYEGPDHTWRTCPAAAPAAVLDRTAEHANVHGLFTVSLVLHGGEPLLAGAGTLGRFDDAVRARVPAGYGVRAVVQTNATLLTEDRLTVLARHGIQVGISLDGGRAVSTTPGARRGSAVRPGRDLRLAPRTPPRPLDLLLRRATGRHRRTRRARDTATGSVPSSTARGRPGVSSKSAWPCCWACRRPPSRGDSPHSTRWWWRRTARSSTSTR
ncbi:radical SAM protein [Streptomyces adustus]|uniref:radical SAM protein n=1 Tax=Streptomyces adustus TaxID=1609272 RepID=UPI003B75BB32